MRDLQDYGKQYGDYPFEHVLVHYRKRKIIEVLKDTGSRRILEIGCGMDPFFLHYEDYDHFCVVEPVGEFYDNACQARDRSGARERIHIRKSTLERDLGFLQSEAFDTILLAGLLHEVEQPEGLLKAVRHVAGPQTLLHVNVPNANSLHRLVALSAGMIKSTSENSDFNIRFQQNTVFDMDALTAMMSRCGYRIQDSGTVFLKPFTHSQMQRMLDMELLDAQVLEGLYGLTDQFPENGAELFVNAVPA